MDSLEEQRNEAERRAIAKALKANAGHRTAAAADLGITERTLYRKLSKYPTVRNLGFGNLGVDLPEDVPFGPGLLSEELEQLRREKAEAQEDEGGGTEGE